VQESLARIAGIALVTLDPLGAAAAEAGVPELCRLLASSPEGAARCANWCGRSGAEAREGNRTVFYRCHAGLHCFAAPVRVAGRAEASILGGRGLERAADVDAIEALADELGLPPDAVGRAVGGLALARPGPLEAAAELALRTAEAVFTGERLLAAERARSSLLASLLALGSSFAREGEPHEVHAVILDAAAILLDLRGAALLVREAGGESFRLTSSFGAPAGPLPRAALDPGGPLLAPVLAGRAPLLTEDRGRIAACGLGSATRRLALFPLVAGEQVLGILLVIDTELGEAGRADIEAFCSQAALALSNLALREQLARRTREIERHRHLRSRLEPLLEWEEVLEAVFQEAAGLAAAREASLMLIERGTGALRVARARGGHAAVLRAVSVRTGEGIAGRVAAEGRPLLVEDVERDAIVQRPRRARYRTGSCLVVPLRVRERVVGVINLADKEADAPFVSDDLEAVLAVAAHASCALQRSALLRRTRTLRELAASDPLTGLANRRAFGQRLVEEVARARRQGTALTLAMLDLDEFKAYNDREGHQAGDALLAAAARLVRCEARATDVAARYGGDEFALLLPDTGLEQAELLLDRIRGAVARHAFDLPGLPRRGGLTLSAGVAALDGTGQGAEALVRSADEALYRAKAGGKNRVSR